MAENLKIDPNTAGEEALAQIPGVGDEMAKRIINARPFASLEDLKMVNGIGSVFLDNISPYLEFAPDEPETEEEGADVSGEYEDTGTISEVEFPSEEEGIPAEGEIAPKVEDSSERMEPPPIIEAQPESKVSPPEMEAQLEGEPPKSQVEIPVEEVVTTPEKTAPPVTPPTKPGPKLATRSQLLWVSFASGLLAFVFAVALLFGILAGINGGLRFATPAQVQGISRELNVLSSQFGILQGDMEGLRTRMDNLEGLSGRVDQVEELSALLASDLGDLSDQVGRLNQQIVEVETQIGELENQVGLLEEQNARYQDFFNGLKDLIEILFPSEVEE
jgi:prefoldin subunit 5